ncbi:hypothetical protein HDU93_002421 [Gonapodya sp. JEL0774]|nr:hypothetical protein HDU93_002421 [Gonapodya sp. JEL0774]
MSSRPSSSSKYPSNPSVPSPLNPQSGSSRDRDRDRGSGGTSGRSSRQQPVQSPVYGGGGGGLAPSAMTSPSAVLNTIGTAILHTGKAGAIDVDEDDDGQANQRRLVVMNAGLPEESDSDEEGSGRTRVQKIKRAINAANKLPPEREEDKDQRLDAAFLELTTLCNEGNAEAQYYLAREFGKDEKWEEALKYFIVASRKIIIFVGTKAGHVPSAYQAGLCFENRRGFDAYNPTYVTKMYNQAAAAGYLPALYRMSDPSIRPGIASACLQMSKGLEKEDEADVDGDYLTALMEVGGEGGFHKARFRLGQIFEQGLYGVVPDPHRAYRYYRKAADHLDGDSMHRLAVIFEKGELTANVDPARAFRYYARASERGIVAAVCRMGEIFEKGELGANQNITQALKCFKDAAHRGSVEAMHHLARIHHEALYGVSSKGPDGALEAFNRAAKKNKPEALYALGTIYEKGQYGVIPNTEQAVAYFEQAAEKGSLKAMIRLGKIYEFGEFGRVVDVNRAVSYYKAASEGGDALGHFLLAGWYYTGNSWLVKKSAEDAFRLLKRAVAGGCLEGAEYRLGSFYEHGNGTEVDMDTAVALYRSAAQRGDPSAIRKLSQMGLSISGAAVVNGRR